MFISTWIGSTDEYKIVKVKSAYFAVFASEIFFYFTITLIFTKRLSSAHDK